MLTLLQHLCDRSNDYSELESQYRCASGAELVTDPLGSVHKGPERITKTASILIGSYNSRDSLEKSLYSIERSSFHRKYPQQLEIVVVDDGSTDGTRDMIAQMPLSVPLQYIRQDNAGLTAAHNTGFAFAHGDVLIFSDSDMVHSQFALEELMKRHEVLSNVTLAGFRFDVDQAHPSISVASIQTRLGALLPEFDKDFRLNFPGRPENICRVTRHWKDYGHHRKIIMANGARYDLPAMVVGGFFSILRSDYIRMGGSDERLVGWGCEDSLIGARSIALGNYIIPVYSAASAHLSHPRRVSSESAEFQKNIQSMTRILNEEFIVQTEVPDRRSRVRKYVDKPGCPSAFSDVDASSDIPKPDSLRLGCFDYALGRFDSSLAHFDDAIRNLPDSPWPRLGKGKALRESGEHQRAIQELCQCRLSHSENPWLALELGITYASCTRYDEARQAVDDARRLDAGLFDARWLLETSSAAHKKRANFHAAEGLYRLSVSDFDLALTVDPNNAWAHFDRGLSLRSLGNVREALPAFQAADRLLHKDDQNRTWIHTELGKCFADLGTTNQAKRQLEIALLRFPGNTQARSCLEQLHNRLEREHGIFCPLSIIQAAANIDGWLTDAEAELLIASVHRAAHATLGASKPAIVEIGSFCGKSTVVIAKTAQMLDGHRLRFYAIDPHSGYHMAPQRDTYTELQSNLRSRQLQDWVAIIRERSTKVEWREPIAFLFVDGLHEYENVKADYEHFRSFVISEGLVAFHDYIDYCPGVQRFIHELLDGDELRFIAQRERMILFQKAR